MLKGANEIDNIAWVLAKSRILYFIYIRANNTRWRNEMSHLLCCQKNIRTRDSNRKFNKFPLAFTKLAPNLKYQNAVYFAQKKNSTRGMSATRARLRNWANWNKEKTN